MKWLTGFLLTTLSISAFAGRITVNSSWEDIEASRRHLTMKPMEFNPVGGLFNACIDGETIRSIKDVKFCADGHQEEVRQGDNVFWEWVCDRYDTAPMSTPRLSSKRECVEYYQEGDNTFCKKFANKPFMIPLEYLIEVQENTGGDVGYRVIFKKPFTVPACN